MEPEHQTSPVPGITIGQPTLRISAQFDAATITGVDVEINETPGGDTTSAVNPQYIGDVVSAVLRATAPLSRLRLTDPPRMTVAPGRNVFHEGGLVR